jgi:REP element-mobilizing transposase RayT
MPRQARLDFEGCFQHVINRGIERRAIFLVEEDYLDFKNRLAKLVIEGGHRCYGWVLMPNHFHLLIETGKVSVSKLMNQLLTGYAGAFNKRHERVGRLFQNRFKSIVCDKDSYFRELVVYIHLNPLRAGIVKSFEALASYPWSGHLAILGLERNDWQETVEVLASYSRRVNEAKRSYLKFMREKKDVKQDLSGGGLIRSAGGLKVILQTRNDHKEMYDTRILGDGEFVEDVIRSHSKPGKREDEVTLELDMETMLDRIARRYGIKKEVILKPGKSTKEGVQARSLAAYLLVRYYGQKVIDVAEKFRIRQPSATSLYHRGEKLSDADQKVVSEILK